MERRRAIGRLNAAPETGYPDFEGERSACSIFASCEVINRKEKAMEFRDVSSTDPDPKG